MNEAQYVNANTPFLEGISNSRISKPWYRVLTGMISVLAGVSGSIDLSGLITEFETSREPKDYGPDISELQVLQAYFRRSLSTVAELSARVELLEEQLSRTRQSANAGTSDPALLRPRPVSATCDLSLESLRRPTRIYAVPVGSPVATTAATSTTPFGFETAEQADALVTLANAMQQGGIKNGIFS